MDGEGGPERVDDESDELTGDQWRFLLLVSAGLGVALLLLVLGITAASHFSGAGPEGPPDAAVVVESVEHDGGLAANVSHRGGEAAAPGDVVIEVDGEHRGNWSALGGDDVLVGSGSHLLIEDVELDQEVRVYWLGDHSESEWAALTAEERRAAVDDAEDEGPALLGRGSIDRPD